ISDAGRPALGLLQKALILAVSVTTAALVFTALYLYNVPVGAGQIKWVVQGRYFLPIAPMALLLLGTERQFAGRKLAEDTYPAVVSIVATLALAWAWAATYARYYLA
ncbi:MAG: hypothetical protein KBC96_12925, partial [Armatimonadetes bacterium]|nr:hypothetical protein [Armatimonadota bacterium]